MTGNECSTYHAFYLNSPNAKQKQLHFNPARAFGGCCARTVRQANNICCIPSQNLHSDSSAFHVLPPYFGSCAVFSLTWPLKSSAGVISLLGSILWSYTDKWIFQASLNANKPPANWSNWNPMSEMLWSWQCEKNCATVPGCQSTRHTVNSSQPKIVWRVYRRLKHRVVTRWPAPQTPCCQCCDELTACCWRRRLECFVQ